MPAAIRPAHLSDIAELVAVENAVFDADRISSRSFRAMLGSPTAEVLVASDGPALSGYCVVLFRTASRRARLYSLAAAPGRSGVGRLLLAAAETAAATRGCRGLRLEVRADNARAIALYQKSGYRLFDQVPDYYEDGAMALRFERPLVPTQAVPGTGTVAP